MNGLKRYGSAFAAGLLAALSLGAGVPVSAAAAGSNGRATDVSGGYVVVACVPTEPSLDPETGYLEFGFESVSLLSGDWTGYDRTTATMTVDPDTFDGWGTLTDVFHGVARVDGSSGTITREGPFAYDGDTGIARFDQKIVRATGDFVGSRGDLRIVGQHATCQGFGSYDGHWVRP